jgi:hypothetical protein
VIYRTQTGEPDEVPTVAYYITTEPPAKGCARRFGELARGHWGGCEIRNHRVRDTLRARGRYPFEKLLAQLRPLRPAGLPRVD